MKVEPVVIFVAILEMHQILPQVHQGGSKLGLLPYLARTLEKMPIFSTAYGISSSLSKQGCQKELSPEIILKSCIAMTIQLKKSNIKSKLLR